MSTSVAFPKKSCGMVHKLPKLFKTMDQIMDLLQIISNLILGHFERIAKHILTVHAILTIIVSLGMELR